MSKRPRSATPETGGSGEVDNSGLTERNTEELFKVCSIGERQIINGHVLDKGTVVELTQEEIDTQRAGGVALEDVHAEDKRDVYSVREPYVAKDSEGE